MIGSRKGTGCAWFGCGLIAASALLGSAPAAWPLHAAAPASASEFHPALGTYHYEVQWRGGLPLAKASLRVDQEDDWYRITLRARTRGLIDKAYRLRYLGEGTITADEWAPVESVIEHKARGRDKTTRIEFLPGGTIRSIEVRTRKGKTRTKVRESQGSAFTLDPFSTVFMARSVDWEVGESEQFIVHDGKHRYEIHLNCQGRAAVPAGDRRRDAWVITTSLQRLDEEDWEAEVTDVVIFLSDDEAKEVLLIQSQTKLGPVQVRYDRFEPASQGRLPSYRESGRAAGEYGIDVPADAFGSVRLRDPTEPFELVDRLASDEVQPTRGGRNDES